jgi:hypothetical protein
MKKISIIILLVTTLFTTAQSQQIAYIPAFSAIMDSSAGPKMLHQCSRSTPNNIQSYWKPSKRDIDSLENRFQVIKEIRSKECCVGGARIDSLQQYGFQYVGVIIKGKKYIYINAFPIEELSIFKAHNTDPGTTPILACDGGKSFWGALFDPESKEFSSLAFNGFA